MGETLAIKVHNLREVQSKLKRVDRGISRDLDRGLRDAAQLVAENARARFSVIDSRSAMGFRPRVRGFGRVVVEQRYRRTTGMHPEYGVLQMRRALIPALREDREKVLEEVNNMLNRVIHEAGF